MTTLEKAEQILTEMSNADKMRLLQRIACDLSRAYPGIDSKTGVCGGEARIAGSRIPVWLLVQYKKLGATEAGLLEAFPTLHAEDLANAWAYYQSNKDEIEQQIHDDESA